MMSEDIKDILKSFDLILKENKSFLNEAAASSTSLFGGSEVKIPADGAHAGQSGWQSGNAWDIAGAPNSPVYAIAAGKVITLKDYGTDVIQTEGKRLYGYGFTVDSYNNLPDVYYTHLTNVTIKQGDSIQCGQLLGYIMESPKSVNYNHVHIGVEDGHNIKEFLNPNGTLLCGGGTIAGESSGSTTSNTTKGNLTIDTGKLTNVPSDIANLTNALNPATVLKSALKEQSYRGQEKFYLQFCNITNPMVRNGQQIGTNTVLGKTDEDVEVSKYDSSRSRVNLKKGTLNFGKNIKENLGNIIVPKDSNSKIVSPVSGIINNSRSNQSCKNQITIEYYVGENTKKPDNKRTSEPRFTDPLLGAILTAPLKVFQDKYDKDTGELKQKRFGYAGERVDPWIKDAIVAPFKKIGSLYRKENKEEEERKKKKVNENIEKIKKLL